MLLRHGQSLWNQSNRFTGWQDVELSPCGIKEAQKAGLRLKQHALHFDICYCSALKRAKDTLSIVLQSLGGEKPACHYSFKLNERHYGALQGMDKDEARARYGKEQIFKWRRHFDATPPPAVGAESPAPHEPVVESLRDCYNRCVPYFVQHVQPEVQRGKNVLVVAHGNSLRAIVKFIEKICDQKICELEIPTGVPIRALGKCPGTKRSL